MAGNVFSDVHAAVEAAVATTDVVDPDPDWIVYADLQARYRALYPALNDGVTVER